MNTRTIVSLILASSVTLACSKESKPEASTKPESAPAAAASSAPKPEVKAAELGVAFKKKVAAVGDKREETGEVELKMAISVDPGKGKAQTNDVAMHETTKSTEEVLAVSGDAPTKVKIRYASAESKQKEGEKEVSKPKAVSGKTYIVEAKDGKVVVTDEHGKAAPKAESEEVSKRFSMLGKPDPLVAAMPTTPLKPGEKVEALAKALEKRMQEDSDGMSVSDVTVKFREKSGDDGTFDVTMKMSKDEGPMTVTMNLTGEVRVSTLTSEARTMSLKGPITVAPRGGDKDPKVKIDGSGSMAISMSQKAL